MSHNTFKEGLGYEGKVTLTLKNNNRVLKSQTYKNNGTSQLFMFLGSCLLGEYTEVEYLLPKRVALLHNTSNTPAEAISTDVEARSGFIGLAQTPSITSSSTSGQAEVKVTYSFEVAKAQTYATLGTFNQIALYGEGYTNQLTDLKKFSAYYYLAEGSEFENLAPSDWSETTVLLIDWELSISNKNTSSNNN